MTALFALAWAAPAWAQQASLRGTVYRASGGTVPAATVVLVQGEDERMIVASVDGEFSFDDVPPGRYVLRVTLPGFRQAVQQLSLRAGENPDLSVFLRPIHIESIVVSGSRNEQTLLNTPVSVTVVEQELIEASAADNVADLLRGIPGVNVVQIGGRDFNFNSRTATGRLANQQLVMVNGRSIYENYIGVVYWDLLTVGLDEIRQIEVVRTPGSAVWGPNALTGVINLLTKSPRQMQGGYATLGVGEVGTRLVGGSWAHAGRDWSYKLSGSYYEQDAFERDNTLPDGSPMPPATVFENEGTRQPKADLRIDRQTRNGDVWSLRGGYAGANGLIHTAIGPFAFEPGSFATYVEADYNGANLNTKLYWNHLTAPNTIVLFGLLENTTTNTFALDTTARADLGPRHEFSYGGTARLNHFELTIAPGKTQRFDIGAFAQDTFFVSDKLSFVLGARLDKFETIAATLAPRLGAIYYPSPNHAIRVAYNKAYRAPSHNEGYLDLELPSATLLPDGTPFFFFQTTVGNLDLEPEVMQAIEIGYQGQIADGWTLSATAYHQEISNNIRFFPVEFYSPLNPPPGWPADPADVPILVETFTWVNIGTVRDRGIELGLATDWTRSISTYLNYAFKDTPLVKEAALPLQLNLPPRHEGAVGVTYAGPRWTASADANYTDSAFWSDVLDQPFWGYTDSFFLLNARVAYRTLADTVELSLAATNLLDNRVKQHVYGDTIPRVITARVRLHLR